MDSSRSAHDKDVRGTDWFRPSAGAVTREEVPSSILVITIILNYNTLTIPIIGYMALTHSAIKNRKKKFLTIFLF